MTNQELRELAKGATPGPWRGGQLGYVTLASLDRVAECRRVAGVGAVANAAFIAAFNPTAVLALLDHTDALQAALRDIIAADDDFRRSMADGVEKDPVTLACDRARAALASSEPA